MDILSLLYTGSSIASNAVSVVVNVLSVLRSFGVPI